MSSADYAERPRHNRRSVFTAAPASLSFHVGPDGLTFEPSVTPSRLTRWQCPHSGALVRLLEVAVECPGPALCGRSATAPRLFAVLADLIAMARIMNFHAPEVLRALFRDNVLGFVERVTIAAGCSRVLAAEGPRSRQGGVGRVRLLPVGRRTELIGHPARRWSSDPSTASFQIVTASIATHSG